jgi:hypothetical protein
MNGCSQRFLSAVGVSIVVGLAKLVGMTMSSSRSDPHATDRSGTTVLATDTALPAEHTSNCRR